MHEENCFITLTFNPESLDARENPWSVDVRDFQLFMKKFRKILAALDPPEQIRFFHCGEYGDRTGRPHYHACIFGFDFSDKRLHSQPNGQNLYTSEILEGIWEQGFCTVGSLTFESAAYVARYIMKKITGDNAADHYQHFDPETGEISQLKPEYTTMSRRPGLASGWLQKYQTDVYPSDQIIMNGKSLKPPRFYDNKYQLTDPTKYAQLKKNRISSGKKHLDNNTYERLKIRHYIKTEKLKQLPRNLDRKK